MALRILPVLSTTFADTLRHAKSRFWTLFVLGLLPALPLVLLSPFIVQVLVALDEGALLATDIARYVTPWTSVVAVLGLLLGFVVSFASSAAMFVALGSPHDPGPRRAFQEGAQRWLAYFWTQLLMGGAVLLVLVPGLLFFTWGNGLLARMVGESQALSLFVLLVSLLLVLPAFVIVTWYALAPILAAQGQAWGVAALRLSRRLVQGATGQMFGFLLAWFLFELLLSVLLPAFFPGLTLFTGFVHYFTTTILGSAYLFTLYQSLRRA